MLQCPFAMSRNDVTSVPFIHGTTLLLGLSCPGSYHKTPWLATQTFSRQSNRPCTAFCRAIAMNLLWCEARPIPRSLWRAKSPKPLRSFPWALMQLLWKDRAQARPSVALPKPPTGPWAPILLSTVGTEPRWEPWQRAAELPLPPAIARHPATLRELGAPWPNVKPRKNTGVLNLLLWSKGKVKIWRGYIAALKL